MVNLDRLLYVLKCLDVPKEFVLCLLLLLFSYTEDELAQDYDCLEFYAGRARTTAAMRKKSFKAARFDKKYNKPDLRHHSNFMDLTHASGFLLACYFILRGRPENFFVMFAVMCSSFCKMNSGTSKRSKCNSIGFDAFPSVQASNMLLERSVLLIYLVTGLGGTWFVEQPNQSVLEYYPTFRKMLMDLFNVRGRDAVYDTKWWMCHYGSASPKRHYAYANTEKIYMLNQGKLYMKVWSRSQQTKSKTTSRKRDAQGKECYQGTRELRATEEYPPRFAAYLAHHCDLLKATAEGKPEVPDVVPCGRTTFAAMQYGSQGEFWSFADLEAVFVYLRGAKRLQVPQEWKEFIPNTFPGAA